MMTIREYQERIKEHNPCAAGSDALSRCKSRKEVFELVCDPIVAGYFLKSIEDGWGPTPEEFNAVFRPYTNGRHTVVYRTEDRKIRSQVFCLSDEVSIPDEVRWLFLIGCKGDVRIADWQVAKVFVDANSVVRLHCSPNSIVYVENHGGIVSVVEGSCKMK